MFPLFSISEPSLPNIPTDFLPSILTIPDDSFVTFAFSAKIPTDESTFIVTLSSLSITKLFLLDVPFLPNIPTDSPVETSIFPPVSFIKVNLPVAVLTNSP